MGKARVPVRLTVAVAALLLGACGPPPDSPPPPTGSFTLVHPISDVVTASVSTRAMSADGRYVALRVSQPSPHVELWDRQTGDAQSVTVGNASGGLETPWISGDGSVVVFTQQSGVVVPGLLATGDEFFRYSVQDETLERVEVPDELSRTAVTDVSISHDGSLVVLNRGGYVLTWTEADGFEWLSEDTAHHGRIEAASLSPNGRFVTVRQVRPHETDPERVRSYYVVYDRQLDAVHAESPGPSWAADILHPTGYDFRLVATTDDGSVIYSYAENSGVFVLDGATGTTSVLPDAGGSSAASASRDGRFVSVRAPGQYFPPAPAVQRIRDRVTGSTVTVGWQDPINSGAWAIADGGREVLVHTWEVGVVPEPGYYLWNRDG
jgi:hypothetical protein